MSPALTSSATRCMCWCTGTWQTNACTAGNSIAVTQPTVAPVPVPTPVPTQWNMVNQAPAGGSAVVMNYKGNGCNGEENK